MFPVDIGKGVDVERTQRSGAVQQPDDKLVGPRSVGDLDSLSLLAAQRQITERHPMQTAVQLETNHRRAWG